MTQAELEQIYYLKKEIMLLQGEMKSHCDSDAYAEQLKRLYEQVSATTVDILQYIRGIEDSTVRQIVFLRCVKLKSWTNIAMLIGGNNTADSVRMMYKRYLRKAGVR